jgi:hypothetical protein
VSPEPSALSVLFFYVVLIVGIINAVAVIRQFSRHVAYENDVQWKENDQYFGIKRRFFKKKSMFWLVVCVYIMGKYLG